MGILNDKDIEIIKSKSKYWNEVLKRSNQDVLNEELRDEIRRLGVKVLFILEHYALNFNKNIINLSTFECSILRSMVRQNIISDEPRPIYEEIIRKLETIAECNYEETVSC